MLIKVKGIVIRSVNISESDKLITIFTEEKGLVTAVANGSRTLKSRYLAASQLFCYSNYVLYKKSDKYWVKEVELIESFFDLRYKIERAALATYICDVINYTALANVPDVPLLRLTLNSIFATAQGKYPLQKIKAAFELRAAAILGFSPDIHSCQNCQKEHSDFYLDIMNGVIICSECKNQLNQLSSDAEPYDGSLSKLIFITDIVKEAILYIVGCPQEKILFFKLDDKDMTLLSNAAEEYLVNHIEQSFKSLDFYKEIAN
jgi:DNA repair protein RecO (recombination protein O)